MTEPRGTPIDESAMPAWAEAYLSADQRKRLDPSLLWILLICQSTYLEASRLHLAHRLHVYMLTLRRGARMEWAPSEEALAAGTNLSTKTVETAVKDLESQGWLLVTRRRRKRTSYRLAWPAEDCLIGDDQPLLCAEPTTKGKLCTRPAGWGTDTPGSGPCKRHREDEGDALDPDTVDPQPLRPNGSVDETGSPAMDAGQSPVDNSDSPAMVAGQVPVDNASEGSVDPQPLRTLTRNHCGVDPQPLRGSITTGVSPVVVDETDPPYVGAVEDTPGPRRRTVDDHPRDGPETYRAASMRLIDLDADFRDQLIARAQADLGPAAGREQVLVRAAALADQPDPIATEPP